MSRRLTCPMGHVWEGDRPHAESGGLKRFRCPTCSAEVVLAISDPNTAGTDPHQTIAEVPAGESPPGAPVVPGYQILEELGRGGMGVVYKARQLNLNRVVALKTVLAGGRHRPDELPRFRREAEAVAKLRSANIVQVYDIGTAGDLTYFTMEFIDGGTLAQAYATTRPTPRRAAELLEPLARAVHAAHQQGVIHRDLKPQNILITAEGTPKLADFGLAKMFGGGADLTPESRTAVLGTPAYAAPEQAMGQARTVGPPADVYGLGAVLYSLLTGAPPFKGETALHTLHLVMTEEPLSPTWFNPRVPRDLETICLKCLRKSPEQRYATAEELAADLRRFLAGEPIRARPTPTWERALKWARRHPAVFTGLTAALLGGLALAVGAFVYAEQEGQAARTAETLRGAAESERDRARTAEALAEANARTARRNQYAAKLELAYQEYSSGRPGRAREILLGQRRQSDWAELNGFAWHRLWRLCGIEPAVLRGHDGPLYKVAVAPDGKLAATGGRDQVIRLWDLATGRNVRELVGHIGSINNLEFSADGERLLGGSFSPDHQLDVRVWSASDGRELAGRRLEGAGVAAAFRPGGHDVTVAVSRNVASGGGQTTVTLWDEKLSQERELYREPSNYMTFAFAPGGRRLAVAATGYYIRVWDVAGPTPAEAWVSEFDLPNCLDYSRDGKWLAVGSGDSRGAAGKVQIRNAVTGAALRTLVGHTNSVVGVAFSPDGQTLASAGGDGLVVLWEVETGRVRETFRGHEGPVESVAFTPDGGTLISVGADGSARLWDCGRRHGQAATTVAWSPDGRTLASGGADHAVLFWDPTVGKVTAAGRGHAGPVVAVAFAPDGQVVASAGADGAVRLWEPATGALKATLVGHAGVVRAVGFAPDGAKLASGGDDGTVRLWKVKDGTATATLSGHVGPVHAVAFNPTARTLVTGGADGTVRFWDPEVGSQILQRGTKGRAVRCLWFAPDGLGLMAGLDDGALAYWAGAKWDPKPETKAHRAPVTAVTATTNGRLVASAGADGAVIVWDWANEAIVLNRTAPAGPALALAFAPDGRTLVSAGGEPRLRIWDVESGSSRPLPAPPVGPLAAGDAWRAGADSELLDHDHGYVWRLAFSADGQGLAAAFGDQYDTRLAGDVKVWQLGAAGRPRVLQGQTLGLSGLSFSPRGDTLASSSWDGSVLLRDAATGFERAKLTGHAGRAHAVAFAPDGSTLASAGVDGTVRLWDAAARQPVAVLTGHAAAVFSLAWTPDGRILISGDRNGMVQFWDAAARKSLGAVKAHAGPVAALAVAPDGHSVASAGFDSRVHIWDLATHEEKLPEFIDSGEVVGAMAYSPDGKTLAVGFGSFQCVGRVRLWDLATRKVRLELAGHRNVVWSVAFSPDGRTLASAALDGTARTWNVATGRELHQWRGASSELWAVAFRPDGRALALGGIDVTLRFVDPTDGRELAALNGHTGPMRGMAWSADGRVLATAGWLNRNGSVVRFWNPETGEETGQLRGTSDMLTAFAMTRDGRLAATGEQSTAEAIRVRLWDVAAQAEVAALAAHPTMQYKALAFSPDGKLLAAGRNDGTVQLWDVESRSCRVERVGHTGPVVSLAFAPDGATLASGGGGGRDYSVKIWNVADLTERVALHGHAADIWGVAFSPDGRTFATGSGDRTVRLWDPVTGQERAVLSGFPSPVSALAFAPDSRSLAVGGYSWVRVLHATRGDDVPMK